MQKTVFYVLRIAALLLVTLSVHADVNLPQVIHLQDTIDGATTGHSYSYLPDPSGTLSANDAHNSSDWISGENRKIVKSVSQGAIWMRLLLKNSSATPTEIKLEHTESRVNKITTFYFDHDTDAAQKLIDFDLFSAISERPYPHHRPVFPLTLAPNATTELLFKFEYLPKVRGAIYTEFRIWKSYAFEKTHIKEATLLMLFYSIHVLMGLITLTIYLVNRDRVFLFYAFYAFATIGTRAATNGTLGFLVYTQGMGLSQLVLPIAVYQTTIFLFSREFLQVKKYAPKWDWVMKALLVCSFFSVLTAFSGIAGHVGFITEIITSAYPIIVVISLVCWKRGVPSALLFAIGWTILLMGGIVTFTARDSGVIEHTPWSYWAAHTGAIIEAFLLASLLASRVIRLGREKALVEKKFRDHLKSYSEELQNKVDQQTIELKKAIANAEREARTDVLTGLTNRRYFMEKSLLAIERAQRNSTNVWLATIDIDFFKSVNDTYGHSAGDTALQAVADVLISKIRNVDIVARIGGEEFALIIEGDSRPEALQICERLRQSVESTPVTHEGYTIAITISLGVAMKKPGETLDQLVIRSDKALYKAKQTGKNRVIEMRD